MATKRKKLATPVNTSRNVSFLSTSPACIAGVVLPSGIVAALPVTAAHDTTCVRISQYLTSVSGGDHGQASQGSRMSGPAMCHVRQDRQGQCGLPRLSQAQAWQAPSLPVRSLLRHLRFLRRHPVPPPQVHQPSRRMPSGRFSAHVRPHTASEQGRSSLRRWEGCWEHPVEKHRPGP